MVISAKYDVKTGVPQGSLAQPILEHGSVIWSPHTDIPFADLSFLFNVINGIINAPDICSCFEFAPAYLPLRRKRLLKTSKSTKNYVVHGPHNRIANLVNSLHNDVDFYGGSYSTFITAKKNMLLNYH